MTLRRVDRFTEDPGLEEKLQRFQEAVRSELEAVKAASQPFFRLTEIKSGAYTVGLDEFVPFDATSDYDFLLPETLPANYGHRVALLRLAGSGSVRARGNNCLVNGAAYWLISSTVYIYRFYSTSSGWRRCFP